MIAIIMGGNELIQRKLRAMTIQGAIVKYIDPNLCLWSTLADPEGVDRGPGLSILISVRKGSLSTLRILVTIDSKRFLDIY